MIRQSYLNYLRFRAENGDPICPFEHSIQHDSESGDVWLTCEVPSGTKELARHCFEKLSSGDLNRGTLSDDIRLFVIQSRCVHERAVAARAILELLDVVDAAKVDES